MMIGKVLFVDVETTGLHASDKMVSFAGIMLDTAGLGESKLNMHQLYLVFDPGKKSHFKAQEVHGFDDWTLRHQDNFAQWADPLFDMFANADLIVAHNAAFDMRFITNAFAECGKKLPPVPVYCTMNAYRAAGHPGSASLTSVCARLGLARVGDHHGALEDAYLAMMIYLWLHKYTGKFAFSNFGDTAPRNLRPVPPRPPGQMPARNRAFVPA